MSRTRGTAPLVSIGLAVFNGEAFVGSAIESLLAQEYGNLEIIVLDNQSTDGTAEIVRRFAAGDPRVRLIVDVQRRGVHEAYTRVFSYARGRYFMLAGDDDLWEPTFLSRLVAAMEGDPELDLVYTGFDWIDTRGEQVMHGKTRFMSRRHSRLRNVLVYLRARCVVPLVFGLFRAERFAEALPFANVHPDTTWDADNVFMVRFLSRARRVSSLPDTLFHYRLKDRSRQKPDAYRGGRLRVWAYYARHQARVTAAFLRVLAAAPLSSVERFVCALFAVIMFGAYATAIPIRRALFVGRPRRAASVTAAA